MARWNTAVVKSDLAKIPGVTKITNEGPGGDYDSDQLVVQVVGTNDKLFVCAFDPERGGEYDRSDADFPMAELSDGQDSRGGLNSDDDNLGTVYLKVRKYLKTAGFEVVGQLKDYF
jgi:hypothetical protein